MTDSPDETVPVEQCGRKPLTLTCRCGAANERSLPYGLNPVDWCQECGMLFGDGDKPPRYMPGFPLSGVPAQSPPPVVSEAIWGGLARDLMMWIDMDPKTPRALFEHLRLLGREIPQWLRDEPEMQALDHVPSKGTRCVLIWRAMNEAALSSPSRGCDLETVENLRARLLAWLGGYRDNLPPEAVTGLQTIADELRNLGKVQGEG